MAKNSNLSQAKSAKNDEFYTQWADMQKVEQLPNAMQNAQSGERGISNQFNINFVTIMKKFLFVFMALVATSITVFASKVYIAFTNGNGLEGVLIHHNDTSLLIRTGYELDQNQEILIKPSRVKYFTISNVGRYEVEDGKFVPTAKAQAKLTRTENRVAKIEERKRILNAANPNEVIAKAFKTTGDICIIAGIPATVAGAILVGIGNSSTKKDSDSDIKIKNNCLQAGLIILPFGTALTLVGFPLHIHGKHIGEIKVNYTGNGAGITMNF